LPPIDNIQSTRKYNNNFNYNNNKSPRLVNDFLMQTWKQKADESNKNSFEIKYNNKRYFEKKTFMIYVVLNIRNPDRKGRSGAGGSWSNISQAYRHDGNRILFVQGIIR
jgi:hypothetical protein